MAYTLLISLLLLFSIIADFNPNNRKLMVYMSLLLVFVMSSFRYEIGYDYSRYMDRIDNIFEFSSRIKIEYLSYLTLLIGNVVHSQLFFAINSVIQVVCLFLFLNRNSKDPLFSLLIFVLFPMFMLNSWSVVRNFSAIMMILFSTKYIFDRNFKMYLLIVGVAFLFHISALIALPLYFIYNRKIEIRYFVMIFTIAYILLNLIIRFKYLLPVKIAKYLTVSTHVAGSKTIIVLFAVVITLTVIFHFLKINKDKYPELMFYYNSIIFSLIFYILMYKFGTISYRLSLYYYIYMIILIPNSLELIVKDIFAYTRSKDRLYIIMKYLTILSFIPMFIYLLLVGGKFYHPYQSILNKYTLTIIYYSEVVL